MKGICAGFKSFPVKSGDVCFVYNFLVEFSATDKQRGNCKGWDIRQYTVYNPLTVIPNEQYELIFEPDYQGRARLVNAILIQKGEI